MHWSRLRACWFECAVAFGLLVFVINAFASAGCEASKEATRRACIADCNAHWDRLNHSPQFQIPYQSCLNACVGQGTAFMGIAPAPPDAGTSTP